MRGTYLFAVAFLALASNALSVEIRPIPTECPIRNSPDYVVHIAHETDCTKFYKCLGGRGIEMDCPFLDKDKTTRLHFNALEQVCDWPGSANCTLDGEATTPVYEKDTTVLGPTDSCPTDEEDRIIVILHECNCNLYYACEKGRQILRFCPAEQYFDSVRGVCADGVCDAIGEPSECSKDSVERTYFSHECNCNKYYACQSGVQEIKKCPEGEHFDIEREICDVPELAGCDRPKPTPTPAPSICAPTGKNRYPYPGNCNKYYDCEDGEESVKTCKDDLHFNPNGKICEDPNKAGCK